ncbi:MAG: DUF3795 domain-containing protein [Atribacterales bacterium]
MKREKGIAYCGLVCAICSKNGNCTGCRNEGCEDKGWCKNFQCCKDKEIDGCWECSEFPCSGTMLDNLRIRTFVKFIKENGIEALLNCLERNEKKGIVYHYPGELIGDYDIPQTEDGILNIILSGESPENK